MRLNSTWKFQISQPATNLQDELTIPIFIEEFGKKVSKGMKNDKNPVNSAGYTGSIFQDFERYLRTEVDLVQDDVALVLDEYISSFITHEILPGIYTFNDLSEVLLRNLQSEIEGANNMVDIEFDDISMKTKLVVTSDNIALVLMKNHF